MCGGGGGGGFDITDPIDWSGAGKTLASVDPGPAIGSGLASADKFMTNLTPYGWALPAALVAAYFTAGGSLAAEGAAAGATEAATAAGEAAYAEAVAGGASEAEAVAAGNAAADASLSSASAAAGGTSAATDPFAGLSSNAPVDTSLSQTSANDLANFVGPTGTPDIPAADQAANAYAQSQSGGLSFSDAVKDTPGFTTDANGNIVQTFDDGSTMTLGPDGTPISSTNAIEAGGLPTGLTNAAQSLAKQAAGKLLSFATSNLAKGVGVKSNAGALTNGLNPNGTDQNITASTTADSTNLTPDLVKGNPNFTLNDFVNTAPNAPQIFNTSTNPAAYAAAPSSVPLSSVPTQSFRAGGDVEGHNPTFFSPGGLASMQNTYVKGDGDGTSDSVAAMLANGEFVIPADVVAKLGNGSNDAGANVLDEFLQVVREHAQNHNPKELPPDSKGPLAYLAEANKKAKA